MRENIVNYANRLLKENIFYTALITYLVSVASVLGVQFYYKNIEIKQSVVEETPLSSTNEKIHVEISGAVKNPGVFELELESRIINLINTAGGLSSEASVGWITKNINLSAKLNDSQKVYIPYKWDLEFIDEGDKGQTVMALVKPYFVGVGSTGGVKTGIKAESGAGVGTDSGSENSSLVNINIASQEDIDKLPGIGPVYATKFIENRPYADLEELIEKSEVSEGVIDKIKDLITF